MVAALLASASQAIIAIDRSGTIVLLNARVEELFGYTRTELLGSRIEMLLPISRRELHEREREEYFSNPRRRPMGIGVELAGRRKDGSEFALEVSLSYLETNQGRIAIAFITDISQRKLLEEQLMHAQKMEAVGRLAGGVAHDFNNMLTVISGYGRMMMDELSPLDPLRGYAEEVVNASSRAGAITNQLLTFSRRQIVQPQVISVNVVIEHTEKMLRRLIGEDVELVVNLAAGIGNIKADPNHLEQAIVNLAVNSRDAMPKGGRILIETGNTSLDENYAKSHMGVIPGEFVMIAVTDNGHGMDAATRQLIFEPFFTTKERGKGTGLGLATVYGMVKQTGGDVWVYSEPGVGTTFKLYFPRVMESAGRIEASAAVHAEKASGEMVLVVEDEKGVRDLTAKMLERIGYRVLTAASGKQALEMSRTFAEPIAVLITDVVMPGMSGWQVAEELRAGRPELKVLYLSGYTQNTVEQQTSTEVFDFLPKPFTREALATKLREVLRR